ncbi:hypothetical protein D4R20_02165 [bacterium]|nr:MAG: hypothetical protein D4R20_02165 [bacterium]
MKSGEYFRFVLNKVEKDLIVFARREEVSAALYLLKVLKNSNDLLRDIYIISHARKLKPLGNYLLFMLKKIESGEVRFDNLIENLSSDKEHIEAEIINNFQLDIPLTDQLPAEREDDINHIQKREIPKTISETKKPHFILETTFKVEEIENELVTEEFIESDHNDGSEIITGKGYLELVPQETPQDSEPAFELPVMIPPADYNRTFDVPADIITHEETTEPESFSGMKDEPTGTKETDDKTEAKEEIEKYVINENEKLFSEIEELKPEELEQEQKSKKTETVWQEAKYTYEEDNIKLPESEAFVEEEASTNTVYMRYESELLTRNALLCTDLDELLNIVSSFEQDIERKNVLISHIIENSAYMEDYSQKMSFEIITGIYSTIKISYSSICEKTEDIKIDAPLTELFKSSIALIESLIHGDIESGFDTIIKEVEKVRNALLESKRAKESLKKAEKERMELEKHLTMKYSDINQQQKLLLVKNNILEVEMIFKSIENIKGEFQSYEALRRLSHAFSHFKEIVNIANMLELRKLAQLAEASYIFVKFVQNYRLNPFEKEITDIFKYIVYNFKLIFLDKPTKDIDLFISYLNDPVKIFDNANKEEEK